MNPLLDTAGIRRTLMKGTINQVVGTSAYHGADSVSGVTRRRWRTRDPQDVGGR